MPAIERASRVDGGDGRVEHRLAEAERAGGDRGVTGPCLTARAESLQISGAEAPASAARAPEALEEAPAHVRVERLHAHAEDARRLSGRNQAVRVGSARFMDWRINIVQCHGRPRIERMSTVNIPRVEEGLEGVLVTKTRASLVDGAAGRLVIAGEDVERLAARATFAEAATRLFRAVGDPSPIHTDATAFARALAEGRQRAFARLPDLGAALALEDGMAALRAMVATMPHEMDEEPAWLVGALAVFVAAHARARRGLAPIAPDPGREHAADFLAMLGDGGERSPVGEARAQALGAYLVTVMDHGLNASTFTARVVASTGSDLVSSVTAAIGALKGPLHGGAPGPVLDMLDAIGAPERAEAWLDAELAAGRRIMGMGHRVYRVRDPRAWVLERATTALEVAGLRTDRLALARAVERAAASALARKHPERSLAANVEFYTAVLLDAVFVPRSHFAATFAVGRVVGWCAHVVEQRATGRLVRPDALYVGELPRTEG